MGIICGWLGGHQKNQSVTVSNMLAAATGYANSPSFHCFSDQSALSIREAHTSPSIYQSKDICTVIEGNHHWRNSTLAKLDREKGTSHALAEGFRRYGRQVLEQLYGEFGLCILKPDENYALLAIDRIGIRPLAYTIANQMLVFGSQIGSILAHPSITGSIDPQGIFNYLYFHMIPSPGTIFQDIYKLQPGEYIEYVNGNVHQQFYWQLTYSEVQASKQDLAIQLHSELDRSVSACMSNEPTGTFLSGGLDSSTVTGVFQSLSKDQIDAFAIGFNAEGFDEMEYARTSARHFNVSLHEYYVTPQDVLDAIPLMNTAYDEPFGNASAIPAYYCAKIARKNGTTILLAGDGGDEIFAGNARYAKQKIFDLYQYVPDILKNTLIEPLATKLPPLRKLKSYIDQSNIPMPERMETYNFLHRTTLTEIFDSEFLKQIDSEVPIEYLKEHYNRIDNSPLVKKMLFLDHKFTLADNDLRKVNRMCELAGINVRYPLLQDSMMAFAAHVPADMLLHRLELRSFYRYAMKDFLAKDTLNKSKHGFGLPFGLWMNEHLPLKAFAHDNLQNFKQRNILNNKYIDKIIKAQQTGHASYHGVFIWVLIMLEQWLEGHDQ